jgi:sensor histidine kinase regulating citrate/malate metabolism
LIFQLYEQYPIFLGIVPVIAILFYAGILITIVSYQEMEKLQEEKKKHFIEEQQVHSIQERMEEVEQFYNGIRQMKHEMRNHLTNIKGLMESGNYEDMQQYLSKMDESMNVFEITIQTGNAVTDVIVNDKQKAASKQGVQFQSEFSYPVSDRYDAYDIGIIVNNLLQNALEACEKMNTGERYITLSGKQKRKFFLIEVRNSFDGEIKFDSNTNLPVSDKEKDISLHGIGLSNVKREVEKYMGDLDIKVKKNEFSVTILLQERRTENEY